MQLVGRRGNDARLLRTARWLVKDTRDASPQPRAQGDSDRQGRGAAQQEGQSIMMMILITGLIGIARLAAFLGIMVWWVKALPLIIIVVGVLGFCSTISCWSCVPPRGVRRAEWPL